MKRHPVSISVGLLAWNEEDAIRAALESVFRQSVFERLSARHEQCEVIVVVGACSDRTAEVAREVCERVERTHDWNDALTARVIEIPEPGRAGAWNRFVHEFSAVEARFLCFMDPRVVCHHRDAIHNLVAALEWKRHVSASTPRRCPDLLFKSRKTFGERLALAAAAVVEPSGAKLCPDLYCLRAGVARNLFIPRDVGPMETEFIQEIACTEFLTRDFMPGRVVLAPGAALVFEAAGRAATVWGQLKRQLMGQAAVRVLVEYLKTLSWEDRINLADTLRRHDACDPDWLKKRVAARMPRLPFLPRLLAGAPSARWKHVSHARGFRKLVQLPRAAAGALLTAMAGAQALRALRRSVQAYAKLPERVAHAPRVETR